MPIRSKKILAHAKGQKCTLRFPGVCNNNPETVVACHIRDRHKGMGQKAADYSVVFGCSDCHRELDEMWFRYEAVASIGMETPGSIYQDVIRALQETWEILIRDGIIVIPEDKPKVRRVKPRKPKEQRKSIPSPAKTNWPKRELKSRNDLKRKEPT